MKHQMQGREPRRIGRVYMSREKSRTVRILAVLFLTQMFTIKMERYRVNQAANQICLGDMRIKRKGITLNDYELPQMNESQIVAIEAIFLNSETPELRERVKFPRKHKSSPYVQEYMSGCSSNKTQTHILRQSFHAQEYICAAMDNEHL